MRAASVVGLRSFVDLRAGFVDLRVWQHQRVPRIFPLQHGADVESVGQDRRHVLAAVNGEVDVAAEQRIFDLLHEQPLAADFRQRRLLQAIARGLDDDDLRRGPPAERMRSATSRA